MKLALTVILTVITLGTIANAAVDSYEKLNSDTLANRATCSSALRGLIMNIQVGGSTADYVQVCRRNGVGVNDYAWASLTLQ